MIYKIGGQEFEPETTLGEMCESLEKKEDFKNFAKESFRRGEENEDDIQKIINELEENGKRN